MIEVLLLEKQLICAQKIHWSFAADSAPPQEHMWQEQPGVDLHKGEKSEGKRGRPPPIPQAWTQGSHIRCFGETETLPITHPLKSLGQTVERSLHLRREWLQAATGQCGASFQAGCSAGDMASGIVLPDACEAELERPSCVGSFL